MRGVELPERLKTIAVGSKLQALESIELSHSTLRLKPCLVAMDPQAAHRISKLDEARFRHVDGLKGLCRC